MQITRHNTPRRRCFGPATARCGAGNARTRHTRAGSGWMRIVDTHPCCRDISTGQEKMAAQAARQSAEDHVPCHSTLCRQPAKRDAHGTQPTDSWRLGSIEICLTATVISTPKLVRCNDPPASVPYTWARPRTTNRPQRAHVHLDTQGGVGWARRSHEGCCTPHEGLCVLRLVASDVTSFQSIIQQTHSLAEG